MKHKPPSRRRPRRRPRIEGLERRQLLAVDGLRLADDSADVEQNSPTITLDVLANDSFDDDYAGIRQISSVSTGSLGGRIEIAGDGGSLRYTAPADADGAETFRYWVDNGPSANVTVNIESPLQPFNQMIFGFQDEYRFDLMAANQFPADYAGEKRITLVSETAQGSHMRISDDGQSVFYQPRIGIRGKDQFSYIVDGRFVGSAVIVVVNPVRKDQYEIVQNSGTTNLQVMTNDFQFSESDPGVNMAEVRDNARITHVLNDTEDFDVEISADGRSLDFTPKTDFHSNNWFSSFRYVVDGRFEQNVWIAVHRPVQDDHFSADVNGGTHQIDVLGNDHYDEIIGRRDIRIVDRVTSVTPGNQGGTIAISDDGTRVIYTPADGFVGIEKFEYVANHKYTASVSVDVTQPVRPDSVVVFVGSTTPINVLGNDFLSDTGVEATVTSVTESKIGASIHIDPGGSIIYTPPEDAFTREPRVFSDSFEYTVNDEFTTSVYVSLRSITDGDSYAFDQPSARTLPVLNNDHFDENYQGDVLITDLSEPTGGGSVWLTPDGRSVVFQPASPSETFTYTVDGKFTETVRTYAIDRLVDDSAVTDQNGPAISIDVKANDFPERVARVHGPYLGDRIITAVTQSDEGGAVSIVDGEVSYVPPEDFVGRDSFTYEIDGYLIATVRVIVIRRAADDLVRVAPDSNNNTLNVLANDVLGADYSLSGLVTDVTDSDAGAEISIAEDGRSIVYTPPAGFEGQDTFVYTIDGQSKATVTVTVHDDQHGLLPKFESTEQLRDFLLDLSIQRYEGQFGEPVFRFYHERSFDTFSSAGPETLEFSETNVQVAGVDEDDIVETDGNFIYTLRGDELTIVKSLPADELELLSTTAIEGTPIGMYLNGDRVTVISRLYRVEDPGPTEGQRTAVVDTVDAGALIDIDRFYPWPDPRTVETIVTVFDVADRTTPQVVQSTILEGDFAKSRRIGDQVFLVLESQDLLIEPNTICDEEGENCVYETEQEFTDRVSRDFATLIEDKLPSYESYDGSGELVRGGPLVLPEDIFQSIEPASSMTIVASINMASHEPGLSATSGVMAESGSDIFASSEHLYVFNSHRETIENEPWTRILKFDWNGQSGAIQFAAIGDVPGTLLNQFSADEHDGLLRVTTEISNSNTGNHTRDDETGLFILQDDHGVLEFIGSMQNLAVGQDVKSVRYFADRAFVTTFQNVDPLHAIDLSDPTTPRAIGHVPILGFSSYMQFISEDRLLTVGTNTATGFGGRAMVSLFDVGDLTAPRLIDQYNLPQFSTSVANFDHHAFGWFARHELSTLR